MQTKQNKNRLVAYTLTQHKNKQVGRQEKMFNPYPAGFTFQQILLRKLNNVKYVIQIIIAR